MSEKTEGQGWELKAFAQEQGGIFSHAKSVGFLALRFSPWIEAIDERGLVK